MKKFLIFLLAAAMLAACGKENPEGGNQTVSCEISTPDAGTVIDLAASRSLTISGDATVNRGEISKVELEVGNAVVTEVHEVPFEYSYEFPEGQQTGELTIRFSVTGDEGVTDTDEVTITITRTEEDLPETLTDSRDGRIDKTVTIGAQTWMAENLAYLPDGEQDDDISWTEPRFYIWGDYMLDSEDETERRMAENALDTYGVFYNWWAAMDGDEAPAEGEHAQGICPEGWHVPSQSEWDALVSFLSESGYSADADDPLAIAKALAIDKADTWMVDPSEEADPLPSWPAVNPEKNNSSGFSGYPIGFRACSGTDIWMHALYSAGWWTSTESSNITGLVLATRMYSTDPYFRTNSDFNPGVGLTVRCLKD